jgi:hypothetical protein
MKKDKIGSHSKFEYVLNILKEEFKNQMMSSHSKFIQKYASASLKEQLKHKG